MTRKKKLTEEITEVTETPEIVEAATVEPEAIEIPVENVAVEGEEGTTFAPGLGIGLNPSLSRRFTVEDAVQIAQWSYNNAVLEALNLMLNGLQILLADKETAESKEAYIFMRGYKGAHDLLSDTFDQMNQEALREALSMKIISFTPLAR